MCGLCAFVEGLISMGFGAAQGAGIKAMIGSWLENESNWRKAIKGVGKALGGIGCAICYAKLGVYIMDAVRNKFCNQC